MSFPFICGINIYDTTPRVYLRNCLVKRLHSRLEYGRYPIVIPAKVQIITTYFLIFFSFFVVFLSASKQIPVKYLS